MFDPPAIGQFKRTPRAKVVITEKLAPFGTTVFAEMTALAEEHGAINLAQGFPDFEGPNEIVEAAVRALRSGRNQYARSRGHPPLVEAIAETQRRYYGLQYDPMTEVVVFNGATEGISASLLG
ncbi:MAG: aminotransferase class I/II-fold pyridoxal phosphate-dependent enzyme, partial [Gemmatimonadetes bacterium]|nr:aminotransferase class I/II-fold pyridoxal phosphate-dependent enzyme [Gemmatimonadota bacterium]